MRWAGHIHTWSRTCVDGLANAIRRLVILKGQGVPTVQAIGTASTACDWHIANRNFSP